MATEIVFDASAALVLLRGEPGRNVVEARLSGAAMTSVNLAEVYGYYARKGVDRSDIDEMVRDLSLSVVMPDTDLSVDAGMLLPLTRPAGLSLADRFCLALARRMGRPALTADRAWATIADAVGVRVELIR
jgi:PIN domain nuclease of toxin-antitoxin system